MMKKKMLLIFALVAGSSALTASAIGSEWQMLKVASENTIETIGSEWQMI